tara:strand:- start:810 stop:1139 length:330 start_codon:yes stop_codon:yes gene_type:complete
MKRGRPPLQVPNDVIFVSLGRGNAYRQINTKSTFFDGCEYFIIKEDEDKITFERAPLDTRRNIKKAVKDNAGWVRFQFTSQIPVGRYVVDTDDSDEDRIVVYYKEQLAV